MRKIVDHLPARADSKSKESFCSLVCTCLWLQYASCFGRDPFMNKLGAMHTLQGT